MNNEEINQFIKAFEDFMIHSETAIDLHEKREEAKKYVEMLYEQKAAELEITVDYYLAEFV
jgi:hypothetical protein